jgi:hypothetical protein
MANQRIGDYPFNDAARDRVAPSRAEVQTLQQSILQLQKAVGRLQTGFKHAPRDHAQEVSGVRRAVHHPRPAPFLQPQPYDDDSSDEHAEGVFDRDYGVVQGEGGRRGARVGAGYEGYEHRGFAAGHGDAYGAQPRHHQYRRKESLEYITNFDLPSFSGHPHFEDSLNG